MATMENHPQQHQHHHHPPLQAYAQSPSLRNSGPYPPSHGSAPTSMHAIGTNYNSSDAYQATNSSASPSTIHSAQSLTNGHGPAFVYGNMSNTPVTTSEQPSEQYTATDPALSASPGMPASHHHGMPASHHHVSSFSAQQKRAYRQRRKDPSCDACRERKVKCDATDTSSCSECSSRGVKCQFTKETNRRMSSIKQVQDLEKQLTVANQQIGQLRTILREGGTANDTAANTANVPALRLPKPNSKEHHATPPAPEGFEDVRDNIRNYARGVFKPPPHYRGHNLQATYPHGTNSLPPRQVADRLISNYRGSVHLYAPHLHWPTFIQEYEDLYNAGTFQHSRHIWVALFYAVLACGTLMGPRQQAGSSEEAEGAQYLDKCIKSIDSWNDELTVDHVRTSFLLSIYFSETNKRSPAWVRLGEAIRIAQDIGLHIERGLYSSFEAEMRRRVWWCVYNWDRIISIEYGRPLMIDDDDCNVEEPTPVDDEYVRPNGIVMPAAGQSLPNGLSAVIPVVRIAAQLRKTLKSQTIASSTLSACDEHFKSIMASWPEPFRINSQAPLDPRLLTAACSLQCMRFFLYRHNLSTACRQNDRMDALERCISVAQDTARYVERTLQQYSNSPAQGHYLSNRMADWSAQIRTMAPAFFCNHLWRCLLVLCLRCEFTSAMVLTHASLAIGDLRKNNISCGRFLAFFLDQIISRLRAGVSPQALETDEAMLAYASGDMQGSIDDAWAWTRNNRPQTAGDGQYPGDRAGLNAEHPSTSSLSEREATEWGGWEHIQRTLASLIAEQQGVNAQQASQFGPHTPGQRIATPVLQSGSATPHLAPHSSNNPHPALSPAPTSVPGGGSFPSSRISIKDIM